MKAKTTLFTVAILGVIGISGYTMLNHTSNKVKSQASVGVDQQIKMNQTQTTTSQSTISQATASQTNVPVEGTYPIIGSHGMFEQYASLEDICKNAELIAEIKVKDQETIPVATGEVSTRSTVDVIKTFKGDTNLKSLQITEVGGLLDLSTIPNMDKPGKGNEPYPNKGIVESAFEGSPVMKKNQSYFVFLHKNPNPKWGYNIVGSVQGKLKIDGNTSKIINTVDSHYLDEDTFFLQRQNAGKDKTEVESIINSKLQ